MVDFRGCWRDLGSFSEVLEMLERFGEGWRSSAGTQGVLMVLEEFWRYQRDFEGVGGFWRSQRSFGGIERLKILERFWRGTGDVRGILKSSEWV